MLKFTQFKCATAPARTVIDVYAEPADTLVATAANYRAAREMAGELSIGA